MTTENKEQHGLYTAAVSFMVSERTENDAWAHIAKFVSAYKGSDLTAEFKMIEQQIKKDFSITTMPPAWRSAKSTALNAHANGVSVVKDTGDARGKTEVATELKGGPTPPKSRQDKADVHMVELKALVIDEKFEFSSESAKTVRIEFVQDILEAMKKRKVK